jgi:putative membrane protein
MKIAMSEENKIRDYLANERTFLAWLRTSVALMGFGLILVKFSVFLIEVTLLDLNKVILHSEKDYSGVTGLVLVVTGMVTLVLSYFNYRRTHQRIKENNFTGNNALILAVTILILSVSIFLVMYLSRNL